MPSLDPLGDSLPPGALARLGSQRLRHPGPVRTVAFLGDERIASTSWGASEIWIWDAADGRLLHTLQGGSEACLGVVARSEDQLAVARESGELELWSASEASRLASVASGLERPLVLITASGSVLAAETDRVCRWQPDTGRLESLEWPLEEAEGRAPVRIWSRRSNRVLRIHREVGRVHEEATGELLFEQPLGPQAWAEVRHEANEILSLGSDGTLRVFDFNGGPPRELGHSFRVVAQDRDGRIFGQFRGGGAIRDLDTGEDLVGHQAEVRLLVASPRGPRLAYADTDGGLHIVSTEPPERSDPGRHALRSPWLLGFLPGGVVAAGRPGSGTGVATFEIESGEPVPSQGEGLPARTMAVAYRGEDRPPAVLDAFGILHWGDRRTRVQRGARRLGQLLVSGSVAVVRTQEQELGAWDLERGEKLWGATTPKNVNDFVTDPAGDLLALASNRTQVLFWSLQDGRAQRAVKLPANPVFGIGFHPRGRWLYALAGPQVVRFDLLSRQVEPLAEVPAFAGARLAVSGCGGWLAISPGVGPLRLYPLRGDKLGPPRTLDGHAGRVATLAFAPGGNRLVTTSVDGTGLVWGFEA